MRKIFREKLTKSSQKNNATNFAKNYRFKKMQNSSKKTKF